MRRDAFRWVHLGALALVVVGLPWSNFLMSLGQLLLVGNLLVRGIVKRDLGHRLRAALTSAPVLVLLSFYVLHVVGLLWTDDLQWGLDLCRILAPVVVFTIFLQASPPLDEDELRWLLLLGAWSTIAVTLWCGWDVGMLDPGVDYRDLSCFISHIRLALLLCFAVCVFAHYWPAALWKRLLHAVAIVWSLHFVARLGSIAGATILLLVALVWTWRWSSRARPPMRWAMRGFLVLVPLLMTIYLWSCVRDFDRIQPGINNTLLQATAGGAPLSPRSHQPAARERLVRLAQHQRERTVPGVGTAEQAALQRRGRSRRSAFEHDHPLSGIHRRHQGFGGAHVPARSRSAADRGGHPSIHHGDRSGLRERIDEVLFELERYRATGDPSGYSLAMRLEFWKAGSTIAREHWIAGVGTGDTQKAFNAQYDRMGSALSPRWRLRAHNEYLTLWISFGAFGFIWCMIAWIWPALRTGAFRRPLFVAWAIAFAISCLTDDTPETQAGATFFAFFYCLFVFGLPPVPSSTD
jgi:hypothetical protein